MKNNTFAVTYFGELIKKLYTPNYFEVLKAEGNFLKRDRK